MRTILAAWVIGASAWAQQVSLVESPTLHVANPPVFRSAALPEHATTLWQEHLHTEEGDLRVSLGGHTGYWSQSIELTFSVDAGHLRDVRVRASWSTDVGHPFEGDFQNLHGRVLVSTTDISSADHLCIAFILTGDARSERVAVNGETAVDLTTDSGKLRWEEERFGHDVALEGDLAAIAGQREVHVFERADGHWRFRDVLPVSGLVSLSETTLAVLASSDNSDEVADALHLYDTRELAPIAVIEVPPDGIHSTFSGPMAFEGDNLLICQRVHGDDEVPGSVLAFHRAEGGWELTERIRCPESKQHYFGESVALVGDVAIVGSLADAFSFERRNGSWTFAGKLPREPARERFGHDLALAEGAAILGAPSNRDFRESPGSVYLYGRVNGSWETPARFSLDAEPNDPSHLSFGWVVEADKGWGAGPVLVAAGTRNAVRVFTKTDGEWAIAGRLSLEATGHVLDDLGAHYFGEAVAVSGKTIFVGAPGFRAVADKPRSGAVLVYDLIDGRWTHTAQLSPLR